jgi:asparagine synthase (glutamine-hydrolysing)
MCGFTIQFNLFEKISYTELLIDLLSKSENRGPDKTQTWQNTDDNCWMGFNRLAIQDLTIAGSQPMSSKSRRYTIVFNGEIYNHLELRKLVNDIQWTGHSDTETIMALIEEFGFLEAISKLDGMFAIAVHDNLENSIYCARDFAGIKPFFYGWNGKVLVGASQYNQISEHPVYKNNDIDNSVLRLYLEQHFIPAPFGLLKETAQLEPGQWMKVSHKGVEKGYFWQFPEFIEPTIFNANDAIELIEQELNYAVKSQLISDVPLGSFLSGGIDSPLITHFAGKNSNAKLNTFTIGSNSKIHDESELAQQYATLIKTNHNVSILNASDIQDSFDEIMGCITEPMADFSIIPTYLVSKFAKNKVTVALSGDGGDELFFGYERFWSIGKNINYQHLPYLFKASIYGFDKYFAKKKLLNSNLLSKTQSKAHQGLHNRFSSKLIEQLFPHLIGIRLPDNYNTYTYDNCTNELELIQKMRKSEFYGMMQKTLRKVDLASMGVSLEVRVPFLGKSFMNAALKMDPNLSYGKGRKKQILKDTLYKLYPTAPIDNIKRGFTIPLSDWLREKDFSEKVANNLLNGELDSKFGISNSALKQLLKEHKNGSDYKWPIFTLLSLK